jgi:hypothetical protein
MTVKWIFLPSVEGKPRLYGVTGVGFQPQGKILNADPTIELETFRKRQPRK